MNESKQVYQWSKQDRVMHLIPAIPLVLFYVGTIYLLGIHSIILVGIFLLLWVASNFAIAGICIGCPYRGGYCPGVSQLYFAPFLSGFISKGTPRKPNDRLLNVSLVSLSVFGISSYIFAFYWLFGLYWAENANLVLLLLGLLIVHMPLSFTILCPKCGYNDSCPMAKVQKIVSNRDGSDRSSGGS